MGNPHDFKWRVSPCGPPANTFSIDGAHVLSEDDTGQEIRQNSHGLCNRTIRQEKPDLFFVLPVRGLVVDPDGLRRRFHIQVESRVDNLSRQAEQSTVEEL